MALLADMIARGWENFLSRPSGPLNFRFVIQPAIASIIAVRAGVKDAREGRPPYLWSAIFDSESRGEFLRFGWRDIRIPFLISIVLDVIYQIFVHHFVFGIAAFVICASLIRQFEFAQNVWINDRKISDLGNERDPIIGAQDGTLEFKIPKRPIRKKIVGLPAFTTVRGGAYFFLPGLKALGYLASLNEQRPA